MVMFSVSSEIIVLRSFLAFGQAHAILLCFLQTLFGCLSSYKYIFLLQIEKSSIHLVDELKILAKATLPLKKVSSSRMITITTTRKVH